MENSVQTTLRLRALAWGPVWICQSFLKGSTLGESEGVGERERRKREREKEKEWEWESKASMVKQILGKESAVNCKGLQQNDLSANINSLDFSFKEPATP